MRAFLLALLTLALLPLAAPAQQADRPNTILVLDGSGSMWGQIDGTNKIVIARNVIAELLADMPDDTSLGLTVYGHRERGSCTDIETIVAPAPFTQDRILEVVNALNPRGRTPMTDAVLAAAQSLRYTEEAATVILVSDGIENCNPDPCAISRAMEEAGIAFTAHVIGFDVASEPEARAQMQCIAENTGGMFLTADNAAELSSALQQVVAAAPVVEPPPPLTVTLSARRDSASGPLIADPVTWELSPMPETFTSDMMNPLSITLDPGTYAVTAYWTAQEVSQTVSITLDDQSLDVALVFETPLPTATLSAPASAVAGTSIMVGWTGPDAEDDFIGIGLRGAEGRALWRNWTYTADGTPLGLLIPPEPGDYVISYFINDGTDVIATAPITVTPAAITLTAPATAMAGTTLEIGWTGPDYEGDFIGIGPVGAENRDRWQHFADVETGLPARIAVPAEPGDYLIGYYAGQDYSQMATVPLTVTPTNASLTAPTEAAAGSTIEVGWTGPGNDGDYIGIGLADGSDSGWASYSYTRDGNPALLTLPEAPGAYVLRYFLGVDYTSIVEVPITVK
ncbi:VWA domain-containing protein [Roseicyclus marinus]|uniref:VWA domain-containing protein n=1 Tax=Roseicyclus marinus TaxID=2161673 RepID=UPI00240ED497|nr:VWA domain-containing protein [Roseicyclus marinus]MDG3040303.1 VWA domain-containing protein [Roseicyclus marinus]